MARSQQKSVWLFVYFLSVLYWPALASLLDVQPGGRYLDIACGNGLTSRRLAALDAQVTAFDFSANLIEKARARSTGYQSLITYHVIDATNEQQLHSLGGPLSPTWPSSIWRTLKPCSEFCLGSSKLMGRLYSRSCI